ncbi:hypothetical protein NUM3379_42480 [Kineococcus sp. NUM-3379]
MQPTTVGEYLDLLPPERRELLARLRSLVLENLPPGYTETLAWGMPSYVVLPRARAGRPLGYLALASQKRYCSVYLMGLATDPGAERAFREAWTATGRRLDMGRGCLRFRRWEDLDAGLLAEVVASRPVEEFLAAHERAGTAGGG